MHLINEFHQRNGSSDQDNVEMKARFASKAKIIFFEIDAEFFVNSWFLIELNGILPLQDMRVPSPITPNSNESF